MTTLPSNPTNGQVHQTETYDYVWNSSINKWIRAKTSYSLRHQYIQVTANTDLDFGEYSSFELFFDNINTTVTISNPPSESGKFVLKLNSNTVSPTNSITWPVNIVWENSTPPDVPNSTTFGIINLYTTDGGTTYSGIVKYYG